MFMKLHGQAHSYLPRSSGKAVLSPADVLERVVQDTAPGLVGVYRWEEAVGHQGHGGVLLGEVQPLEVKEPLLPPPTTLRTTIRGLLEKEEQHALHQVVVQGVGRGPSVALLVTHEHQVLIVAAASARDGSVYHTCQHLGARIHHHLELLGHEVPAEQLLEKALPVTCGNRNN